jgi:ketosteroid isomerase-like protein
MMTNEALCTPAELAAARDWVARFQARWRTLDPDALRELMHPDTQNQIPPMAAPADCEGVVAHFKQAQAMLPGLRIEVVRWAASGDAVFIEWTASATVNGHPIAWTGVDRVRLRDHRTYEGRVFWDTRRLAEEIAQARQA